jgi:hypothetical protein
MKNIISAALFYFLLPSAIIAQTQNIDVDKDNVNAAGLFHTTGGTPYVEAKFTRLVSGTPYFKNEWMNGILILKSGIKYKGQLKLDLYSNEVHYLDDKKNEFVVDLPIKQVAFVSPDTSYLFLCAPFVQEEKSVSKDYWYLQLYSDSVSLYKYFQKKLSENRPYSSATYEQTIRTADIYWVYYNGTPIEVKKLKDAASLFGDKKDALNEFLKNSDNKHLSMDERMIAFVKYLNSLVKK